jgi:hypothetical protein
MSAKERKQAFKIGLDVSRRIRRRCIEQKINAPLIIKRVLSQFYTEPFVERFLVSKAIIIRLKEKIRGMFLKWQKMDYAP